MAETITAFLSRTNALDTYFKLDKADTLFKFQPGADPFLAIITKLASTKGSAFKHEWFNKNPIPTTVTHTGADESSAGATGTIAKFTRLRKNDVLFNMRTQEKILVTATPSTATVTWTRDVEGNAPGALLRYGDTLMVLSTAVEEGTTNAEGRHINPSDDYNWQQLREDYAKTTWEAANSYTYTGQDVRQENLDDMKAFHKKKLELDCMFGARFSAAGVTFNRRGMGGLFTYIASNRMLLNSIADFSRLAFDDYIRRILEQTPDAMDRWFFCAPQLKSRMTNWGYDIFKPNSLDSNTFGFEIEKIKGTAGGSVNVVECPQLVGDPYLSHVGFLLDMSYIQWIPWMATTIELNVQAPNEKLVLYLDKVTTRASLRVANELRHGIVALA